MVMAGCGLHGNDGLVTKGTGVNQASQGPL